MKTKNQLRLAKLGVNLAVGAAFSVVLGYIIKAEYALEDRLDEHFDRKIEEESSSEETA